MKFEKIVQKMKRKWQNLWSLRDIDKLIVSSATDSHSTLYKTVHLLVASWVLVSIRKWLYLSWQVESGKVLDPQDFYWNIVRKTLADMYLSQGVIIWRKGLALMLKDFSLPEVLSVCVPKNPKKITLLEWYMMTTINPHSQKKSGLYGTVKKYATKMVVDDVPLWVTCPEHAILESLIVRDGNDINDTQLLLRWLKKNSHTLRAEVFAELIPNKYISAANRLKYIAFDNKYTELYTMMVKTIDLHWGGCHLSREFLER